MSDANVPAADGDGIANMVQDNRASAPPLPLETHAINALLALQMARHKADLALGMLQFGPRFTDSLNSELMSLRDAVDGAMSHYAVYCEVLSCGGSA